MTTSSDSPATDHVHSGRLGIVLAVFALLLAPVGLLADKAVVPLVLVTAVAGGLAAGRPALTWRLIDRRLGIAVGALLAWCLISSAWSPAPLEAAALAVRVGLLIFVLLYLAGLTACLDAGQRRQVALSLAAGCGISLALLLVELTFRTPLFDLLQGKAASDYAAYSRLNRGVSALAILVWPLAAFAWQDGRRVAALLLPLAVLAVASFSQSSASVLALGAAVLATALSGLGRRAARLVMAAAVAGAVLGSPLLVVVMQHYGLEQSNLLPETARYRLHIWSVVDERIAEKPLTGWGFDASPDLPTGDAQPFRPGESVIPSHPHNGALQILVELGVPGSLLTLIFLFLVGQRIDRLPPPSRSAAVGLLVTIIGVACTAYGIWQNHWLSVIGAAGALFAAVLTPAEGAPGKRP